MPGFGQPAQMGAGPGFPAMEMPMPPGMTEQQQSEFQVGHRFTSCCHGHDAGVACRFAPPAASEGSGAGLRDAIRLVQTTTITVVLPYYPASYPRKLR